MQKKKNIIGVFDSTEQVKETIKELRDSGFDSKDLIAYTPFPDEEIISELGGEDSPVKFPVLFGGIFGFLVSVAITMIASYWYILPVGGKPIYSVIPYGVIYFELTVLSAAIFNLLAFLFFNRLPDILFLLKKRLYREEFSADKLGVLVVCDTQKADLAKSILSRFSKEVRIEDA